MAKRLAAVPLWSLAGWVAGAMVATFLGVTPLLAPALGATAGVYVWKDPGNRLFAAKESSTVEA